ncbi:DUF262 domain-containing protein [Neptunomonas qingdaonensis]|uniref:DUF262 domain-containing protein n=1 Tax=Neptunomonas qingdaonensis TaxID=1045558 RepID=A0A1I2QMF1_9GAMM|nr:DUF262 domain-containing protein [Neptunomonas qingdaonensis]SFG29775.1 Protein of unknown function [Neptunomonas qingdaonensis]
MTEFRSTLITLQDVINNHYFFNIPIYQRLYVWKREQIHTLLDDIFQAYDESKNEFYLGGTLVIERDCQQRNDGQTEYLFDLIDGQQRFTTLWLVSVVLGEQLTEYSQGRSEQGLRPRIGFAIRPQVTDFFARICRDESASLPEARQLEDALQEIRAFINNYQEENISLDLAALSVFIRDNIQLVLTRVPKNTDLNKLFEVINNRGIQLQHHEILKSKLLEILPKDDQNCYGQLWDACADMNGYVERHLRAVTKIDTVTLFEDQIDGTEKLAIACNVIATLQKKQQTHSLQELTLESILNSENTFTVNDDALIREDEGNQLPDRVNSIISFSMLLQHVLRIYLHEHPKLAEMDIAKVSDKDLLLIFKEYWLKNKPDATQVKQFIELLWETRYQFDKHVIKWVLVEEEKVHAIRRPYVNRSSNKGKAYLQRYTTDAAPDFAALQSMLYHSQQMTTQYWLTPLLNFLLKHDEKYAELYLQHLDNHLLCSEPDASLIQRTRRFLDNIWHTETLLSANDSLNKKFKNGTQYPHYWFYKLEYVLYLQMKSDSRRSRLIDSFRMTAKNSVEHIAPQHPENEMDKVEAEVLHCFGNLALVTRSINSEMSNKGFGIKRAEFLHRHQGKGVSLKLEHVFETEQWLKPDIQVHQDQMIQLFDDYMKDVTVQVGTIISR